MPKRKTGQKANSQKQILEDDGYPKISILTPLYNRNKWLPLMIANINSFDYDKNKMEWFILDSHDGEEEVKLFQNDNEIEMIAEIIKPVKLKYVYLPRKMTIAEKRNYLTKNMTHPYFANCDSDDIFMESYLKYSIDEMRKKKTGLAGSNQMIFCFPHLEFKLSAIQCPSERQAHEGTFVGTKKYWKSMSGYSRNDQKGEGASLIDGNEKNIALTECKFCMVCIAHNNNTCSKTMFQDCQQQDGKIQGLKAEILKEIMAEEIAQGFQDNSEFSGEQEKPPENMEQLQYNEEQTLKRPHFKEEVEYKEKQLDKDYLKQKK
jgi:hypothetical protein